MSKSIINSLVLALSIGASVTIANEDAPIQAASVKASLAKEVLYEPKNISGYRWSQLAADARSAPAYSFGQPVGVSDKARSKAVLSAKSGASAKQAAYFWGIMYY